MRLIYLMSYLRYEEAFNPIEVLSPHVTFIGSVQTPLLSHQSLIERLTEPIASQQPFQLFPYGKSMFGDIPVTIMAVIMILRFSSIILYWIHCQEATKC